VTAARASRQWSATAGTDPPSLGACPGNERHFRPAEVDLLIGDGTKARERLGWEPTIGFEELVAGLVDADLQLLTGKLNALS